MAISRSVRFSRPWSAARSASPSKSEWKMSAAKPTSAATRMPWIPQRASRSGPRARAPTSSNQGSTKPAAIQRSAGAPGARARPPAAPTRLRGPGPRSRAAPARRAQPAQLEQVFLDAESGGPPHSGQGALERAGVELAGAAATGAHHRVVAARLASGAGTYRGGSQDTVQQAQLEQRGDVPVHGHPVHGGPAAAQLALQLARAQRA